MAVQRKTSSKSISNSTFTHKQANAVQEKLRIAIRATTKLIDKKGLNSIHVRKLKRYRKMLQNANEWYSWNITTIAIN